LSYFVIQQFNKAARELPVCLHLPVIALCGLVV